MKKVLILILTIAFLVGLVGQAGAIYTPTGPDPAPKEDIAIAEKVINGLKWDVSQASKGVVKVVIPKVAEKYSVYLNRNSLKDDGTSLPGGGTVYSGSTGTTISIKVDIGKKIAFDLMFGNDYTGRVLAEEEWIYYPDSGLKYIQPDDRRYAYVDENGNVTGWVDGLGNQYDKSGNLIPKDEKPKSEPVKLPFSDIAGHWALNVIKKLSEANYIKGYPDGSFRPENNITRAEFMIMLLNILNDKYSTAKKNTHDLPMAFYENFNSTHWAYKAVNDSLEYMPESDITRIFKDKFDPNKKITREEVVAVLSTVLADHNNFKEIPAAELVLDDTNKSEFQEAVKFSLRNQLVMGYPDNTFKPQNKITRAEIAAVLVKMIEKL